MEDRCLATAQRRGVASPEVVPGAQNLVLVAGDRVLRFPRYEGDAARVQEIFARHARAHAVGLTDHPPVSVVTGPVGVAHVELVRVEGTPLPRVLAAAVVDPMAVAESLVAVLSATRRVSAGEWPFPQQEWVPLWAGLPRRARAHRRQLPPAVADDWIAAADRAAAVAAAAPLGLMHGDLQGHNVLVGQDATVAAVLDWDSALIGDPAMDTVAALYDFPLNVQRAVVERHDWVAADLSRFEAYRATWVLQAHLWDLNPW